jgi:DNA-binding PadR family transcriptional regulator
MSIRRGLREQTYLILLALADGPLHGYGVIQAVRDLSAGEVKLGPGTLYGALDRLSVDGLVAVTGEEVVEGRHRRYYALTDDGHRCVAEETARLSALVETARRRLSAVRPKPVLGG